MKVFSESDWRRYNSERNVSKKYGSIFLFLAVVFFYIDSILFVTCLKTTPYGRTNSISVGSVSACQGVTDLINEFYVLLTVHAGTALGKCPTWCTIALYNTFIIIILYMFRATLCSSSGSQIVLTFWRRNYFFLILAHLYTKCE